MNCAKSCGWCTGTFVPTVMLCERFVVVVVVVVVVVAAAAAAVVVVVVVVVVTSANSLSVSYEYPKLSLLLFQ